jgi:hypothetical protein
MFNFFDLCQGHWCFRFSEPASSQIILKDPIKAKYNFKSN